MSRGEAEYAFAIRFARHRLLVAGDAWPHEHETVDLLILWVMRDG